MASNVRPQDLPPFPVLSDDLDRHHVVAGLWLWMTEIRFRYPNRDVGQLVLDALGAEHEKFGQRMVSNPFYEKTAHHYPQQSWTPTTAAMPSTVEQQPGMFVSRVTMASVANALRQSHVVICRSLARTLGLSAWWATATVQPSSVTVDTALVHHVTGDDPHAAWARAHHNARKALELTMLRDSRARTDLVPDAYLPIDVFRDSLPSMHVLL